MKNIKDIMKDMNNISQQLEVTINNELDAEEGLEVVENLGVTAHAGPSCVNTTTTCGAVTDASRDIEFCCSVPLPGNFIPNTSIAPKILLDLSCLKAVVEPCSCNGIPKWDIRIIGSIPFIVNINIDNTGVYPYPSDATIATCYSNTISVDKVIANKCTYEDAIISRSKIIFNSNTLSVPTIYQTFNKGEYFVKVTGTFKLPACP